MNRAIAALIGCALLSVAVACGSGGVEDGVTFVVEADLSDLPQGTDSGEAMDDFRGVMERRLKAADADFEIRTESANRLSVTVAGISPQEGSDLLGKTARLEFRAPVLDNSRNIVCESADGSTYAVPFQPGLFNEDKAKSVMACPPGGKGPGVMKWEPATGTDSQGTKTVLTGNYLKPNARVLGPPVAVTIEFTGEGGLLFEQITGDLVALPLAIFLDEELLSAPTVQQQITGGSASIGGLTAEEAKTLAIQLNAGALPVPVKAIWGEVKA